MTSVSIDMISGSDPGHLESLFLDLNGHFQTLPSRLGMLLPYFNLIRSTYVTKEERYFLRTQRKKRKLY
jgi:hypothetical protein